MRKGETAEVLRLKGDAFGSLRVKSQLSTFSLHFESVDLVIADVRARSLCIDVQDGWYHVLNRGSKDARSFSGNLTQRFL